MAIEAPQTTPASDKISDESRPTMEGWAKRKRSNRHFRFFDRPPADEEYLALSLVALSRDKSAPFSHIPSQNLDHKCSICGKAFPSYQALGGHKRCHCDGNIGSAGSAALAASSETTSVGIRGFDLNLPPVMEFGFEDEEKVQFSLLLSLTPGPAVPVQPSFSHQNASKNKGASMTSQWQKQKLIGSGAYGNVYQATNRLTGALCAMKEVNIIPDDPKSAECLKQLEQEIEVLSKLKHPNIVQYYGSEVIEDRFFIYLEYVYPGSINKYVQEYCGAMTESVVQNFTHHILKGLAYLHSTDNIHRDIKGANLLVDVNGVVKLADFGMAKHLSGAAPALSFKGTSYWMAPEVLEAKRANVGYDFAVDIWSLGCTIIEMFTGKHLWSGDEQVAAMFKVLHKDPPIPENLSSEGKDFLQRCLRRNPAERPTAIMLLDHPFIRKNHYNLHGSIQASGGIKLNEITNSSRDKPRSKSDPSITGRQTSNGEINHSHAETCESATYRLPPRPAPDIDLQLISFFPWSSRIFNECLK